MENAGASDMGLGLSFVFGLIAVIAALVTTVTSFIDATGGGDLQLVAGLAMAVTMIAGGLAIVAIHAYS
jgi:hypothetical protein